MKDYFVALFFCILMTFYIDGTRGLPEAAGNSPGTPSPSPVVVVTGFEPYGRIKKNPSWEAVAKLPSLNLESELDITLITKKLPVVYAEVEKQVPDLWQPIVPKLTVHVALNLDQKVVTLVKQAHKSGYGLVDANGQLPTDGTNPKGTEEILNTELDVVKIQTQAQNANTHITVNIATDAERYVAAYLYYTSLSINRSRTLFMYVPKEELVSIDAAADTIKTIIKCALGLVPAQ